MTPIPVRMIVVLAVFAACTSVPTVIPTEAEAQQHLGEIVRRAQAGNIDAVCDLGGPNCRDVFREAGSIPPPAAPPMIVTTRVLAETDERAAGLILELCGVGSDGQPYSSEILISRHPDGDLVAIEPIYWSNLQIDEDGTTGRDGRARPPCATGS